MESLLKATLSTDAIVFSSEFLNIATSAANITQKIIIFISRPFFNFAPHLGQVFADLATSALQLLHIFFSFLPY